MTSNSHSNSVLLHRLKNDLQWPDLEDNCSGLGHLSLQTGRPCMTARALRTTHNGSHDCQEGKRSHLGRNLCSDKAQSVTAGHLTLTESRDINPRQLVVPAPSAPRGC